MGQRFSFIVIPEHGGRVRRLRLSSGLLKGGLCALLSGVVLLGLLSWYSLQVTRDETELQRLRLQTAEQRRQLQQLSVDLTSMQAELRTLAESEARVRQLAELDTGPWIQAVPVGGFPEEDATAAVGDIQQRIDQLQVAIDLRRQSLEGARNLLNDQASLSRATPRGWPTRGWLSSYFGMRTSPFTGRRAMHEGLDIAANQGTPIVATADGTVVRVEYSPSYGKTLVIDHGYGYRTIFGHNAKILVKPGQKVRRGQRIAQVGNTGRSTGSHLHYELRLNGVPIDPRKTL